MSSRADANRREPRRDVGAVDPRTDEPMTISSSSTGGREAKAEALASFDPEEVVFTIPHFDRSTAVLAHSRPGHRRRPGGPHRHGVDRPGPKRMVAVRDAI